MGADARSFASVILAAAGEGRRLAAGTPKASVRLLGRSLLDRSVDLFASIAEVAEIVIAAHADDLPRLREDDRLRDLRSRKVTGVVAGGRTRLESVACAFRATSAECSVVAVHDAARPLTPPAVIQRVLEEARTGGAAIAAAP